MYDDATDGLRTNKSKLFPFLDGQPEKIARLHAQAKSLVQQQEVDAFHSAQDDLAGYEPGRKETPEPGRKVTRVG